MRLPSFQISLRTLLLLIVPAAVTSYLIRLTSIYAAPLCIWFVTLVSLPVIWRFRPPDPPKHPEGIAFLSLLVVAVYSELYAAYLAHYTIGEIASLVYILAIGLNVLHLVIALKSCKSAILLMTMLWISLVPYQLTLMCKWTILDREMRSIITLVEAHRTQTGTYPPNIDGILTGRRSIAGEISYRLDPKGGFDLSYNLGSENTAHTYSSSFGHFYYPD